MIRLSLHCDIYSLKHLTFFILPYRFFFLVFASPSWGLWLRHLGFYHFLSFCAYLFFIVSPSLLEPHGFDIFFLIYW